MHDALLIKAGTDEIEDAEQRMQAYMIETSQIVLGSLALRADTKRIAYFEHYLDGREAAM